MAAFIGRSHLVCVLLVRQARSCCCQLQFNKEKARPYDIIAPPRNRWKAPCESQIARLRSIKFPLQNKMGTRHVALMRPGQLLPRSLPRIQERFCMVGDFFSIWGIAFFQSAHE
jgi:hypothetical protein